MKWLVKTKRWDGSESVINAYSTEAEARQWASKLNTDSQSTNYWAEAFTPERGFRG